MKTILFPTDFSENAEHASLYAAMLAKLLDANIYLLNVYFLPSVTEPQLSHEIENMIRNNKIEAEIHLQKFTDYFSKNANLPPDRINQIVDYGNVADKIAETAKAINADMIVMGTKGATNALERWLGTNAQNIMKKAECPVWIIPENAEIKHPIEIMYAADFKEDEIAATHKIVNLSKALGASCRVIHVHEYFTPNVNHIVEATEASLKEEFKDEDVIFRHINRSDITKGLDKYIETHKPDVLAMAIEEKSFFNKIFDTSITNHFVFGAKLPIITFKK